MEQRPIDANALIEEFEYYIREAGWNDGWNRCLKDVAIECTKNAPTIEAEPVKHGKWEIDSDFFPVCSNCKYKPLEALTRYCPNCGARMDGDINGKSS